MKIEKCAKYFQWCIQGLVWASGFFGKQKAARLREPRLKEQGPQEKLPYLQSESREHESE